MKIIQSAIGGPPSMGLIKEFQNLDVEVIGIDANPLSFGLYFLKKNYLVPFGDNPNFINEILKIIDIEQPDAILLSPNEEIISLSKNKKNIEKKGPVLLCPDFESVDVCTDKLKTAIFFNELKIPAPKLYDSSFYKLPCIIKPKFGRGSRGIHIIKSKSEFDFFYKKAKAPIIQEYIEGNEYSIDIIADKNGNSLSIVPRLRLYTESGISLKGKTIYDKEIINYCEKIVKELKLFGPSCIQCIRGKDGLKFIEINNRFGGGSILSIKADPTILPNLIKLIKGEKPTRSKGFKEGLIMLRYYSEIFLLEHEVKENNL